MHKRRRWRIVTLARHEWWKKGRREGGRPD
jgi:hypothetical protein